MPQRDWAPGGMRFPSKFGVKVATNGGRYTDDGNQTWKQVSGTSVAAPLVSGTLALMRSVQPTLSNVELTKLLLASAAPFPTQNATRSNSVCDTYTCGVGLLNAHHAVRTAVAHRPGDPIDTGDIVFDDGANPSPGGLSFEPLGCSILSQQANTLNASSATRDPSLLLLVLIAIAIKAQLATRRLGLTARTARRCLSR